MPGELARGLIGPDWALSGTRSGTAFERISTTTSPLKEKPLRGDYATVIDGKGAFRAMTTQQTFEQIAREQHAMITRIASSHEAKAHLVEDLVQDIYFAIGPALPSFRGDSSLRTFVARIATNRSALKFYRPAAHFTRRLVIPEIRLGEWSANAQSTGQGPSGLVTSLVATLCRYSAHLGFFGASAESWKTKGGPVLATLRAR